MATAGCGGEIPEAGPTAATAAAPGKRIGLVMKSLANEFFATIDEGAKRHQHDDAEDYELIINGVKDERDLSRQVGPHDRRDMLKQMCFQGVWHRHRSKTPKRTVATRFGTITQWRMLYQLLHGDEPSIVPLEIHLGLEAGLGTPVLPDRVALAATAATQDGVIVKGRWSREAHAAAGGQGWVRAEVDE